MYASGRTTQTTMPEDVSSITPPESNFGNKKVVNFRGFGVPTARPEGAKGRTGLGWVWNGHFRPPWGWLLGDFFVP